MKAIEFEWTVLSNGVKRSAFWRLSHATFRDAEASARRLIQPLAFHTGFLQQGAGARISFLRSGRTLAREKAVTAPDYGFHCLLPGDLST